MQVDSNWLNILDSKWFSLRKFCFRIVSSNMTQAPLYQQYDRQHKDFTKKFEYTTIADRLRTPVRVSLVTLLVWFIGFKRPTGSSGGRVVKLLACGARGPGFDSWLRHLNFQRLVISCFQVAIWLKYR